MKHLVNVFLLLALLGAILWGAVAPGMQALIPLFIAIVCAIALLKRRTDFIQNY